MPTAALQPCRSARVRLRYAFAIRNAPGPAMRLFTVLTLCALASAAHASDDNYSDAFGTCMDTASGVTAEMIDCIGAELGEQDQALNAAYKALGATLDGARKAQLTTAQRAWVAFRDGNCAFYADPDGGTLARVSANDCVLRMTAERAAELQTFLDGP